MKNETSAPMNSQPDNKPMSYGPGVTPMSSKGTSAPSTLTPVGKTSAPWQAGHGSGISTNYGQAASRTAPKNLG